jgi:hypothetical protein
MDPSHNQKVLIVESDNTIQTSIVTVLTDAGYEVSTDHQEGMKSVLTFNPDAVILVNESSLMIKPEDVNKSQTMRWPFGARDPTGECVNSRTNLPSIHVWQAMESLSTMIMPPRACLTV